MKTTQLTDLQVSKAIKNIDITFSGHTATANYEDKAVYIDVHFDLDSDAPITVTIEQFDDPATIDNKQLSWIIQAIRNKEEEKLYSEEQQKKMTEEFFLAIANNTYFVK